MDLIVQQLRGWTFLTWDGKAVPCTVGRAGIEEKLSEGDGVTPKGRFPLRRVLYRADRVAKLETRLPIQEIASDDGWCDAPEDANYNRHVKLPYLASHEKLWREDHLYDVVVVVGFNDDPVMPGKGSAIFLHVAREDFSPTEGCVALKREDLLAALKNLKPGDGLLVA